MSLKVVAIWNGFSFVLLEETEGLGRLVASFPCRPSEYGLGTRLDVLLRLESDKLKRNM